MIVSTSPEAPSTRDKKSMLFQAAIHFRITLMSRFLAYVLALSAHKRPIPGNICWPSLCGCATFMLDSLFDQGRFQFYQRSLREVGKKVRDAVIQDIRDENPVRSLGGQQNPPIAGGFITSPLFHCRRLSIYKRMAGIRPTSGRKSSQGLSSIKTTQRSQSSAQVGVA